MSTGMDHASQRVSSAGAVASGPSQPDRDSSLGSSAVSPSLYSLSSASSLLLPTTLPVRLSSFDSPTAKVSRLSSPRSPRASTSQAHSIRDALSHPSSPKMNPQNQRSVLPPSSPGRNRVATQDALAKARARDARRVNDSMVYLDGPLVYTCAQCRTHLTSHDDIISKSFHGRHGRAYLFDQCVNVTTGPIEERPLITGLHTVCDIFCKRCKTLVGWTYEKAYEATQKYKEGKFIVEKINLHMEESITYSVAPPAGERRDRWRRRASSWGENGNFSGDVSQAEAASMIFEYRPSSFEAQYDRVT